MEYFLEFGVNIYCMRNRIRKFTEAIEANKFQEVIDEIKSMIEKTINPSENVEVDQERLIDFIESYSKGQEEIEKLISDSDIYDFYLKYRNQIDDCLKEIKFYDKTATEINAFGLYEYVIKGTMVAIKEFVSSISKK
jgi:hypothetical protein